MIKLRNYKGEKIESIPQLIKPEYGTGKTFKNGMPQINWPEPDDDRDSNGFDKHNVEENGQYIIKTKLPQGTVIIRYGREAGSFSAPEGTKYEELSLPYKKETVEYNRYRVISNDLEVECIVDKGRVAPAFGSKGGGIQYKHNKGIINLIQDKVLERI